MDNTLKRKNLKNHQHDRVFYVCFSSSKRYVSLAKLALGQEISDEFDWRSARKEETRQIDVNLRETRQDFKFSVRMKQAKGDDYRIPMHLEHKSHKESGLMRQLYQYQTIHNNINQTPLVSIVVYHGKDSGWRTLPKYQQSLRWGDDEYKQRLINIMGENLLDFGGYLLNLRELVRSGEQLDGNIDAVVYLLSEIWDLTDEKLKIFFQKMKRLTAPDREEIIIALGNYVKANYPNFTMKILDRITTKEIEDDVLTFKYAWAKELDEANEKTEERIVLHMAGRGIESDEICEMTGIPRETVDKYRFNGKGRP